MSFYIVPLMPKQLQGSRESRGNDGLQQAIVCTKVGGEWQIVATVQLEALKAIAVFEASVQPHDTSPSHEYLLSMLERNKTIRNETVNAVFLKSCALLLSFYGF